MDEFVPYSKREDWKDVTPVPQDDGPEPLVVIRYPPNFEEVHDYFRAIVSRNEFSQRAMELTADVIENNSANYTAWYYRRRCLTNEKSDLSAELEFTDRWAKDSPKNYQVMNFKHHAGSSWPCDSSTHARTHARSRNLTTHMDHDDVSDTFKSSNHF